MTVKLWESTLINNYQSSLVTGLSSTATVIYLPTGATGLVAPGIVTLDQFDSTGALTTTVREYISFTSVTSTQGQLSGLTRGLGGSSTVGHLSGALIEGLITVTHFGDMIDFLQVEHDSAGKHVISTATVNYVETKSIAVTSLASTAFAHISTNVNASGASVTGIADSPLTVRFNFTGIISGASTNIHTPVVMPRSGSFVWASVITPSVASAASVIFDINKNGVSIFSSGTRPSIVGGGTFVSTASILTTAFSRGDQVSWDYDGPSNIDGMTSNFNIFLHTT